MTWSGGAWPRSKIPVKSSPIQTLFTQERNSTRKRWFRAITHDSARHVSKPGSLSPRHKFRVCGPSLTPRDAKGSQLCKTSATTSETEAELVPASLQKEERKENLEK